MIQIVVNGVFAEDFKETNVRHVYRSFSRTFSIVPVGNGWGIISDMLFVTVVTDEILLVSEIGCELVYNFKINVLYSQESSKRFYALKAGSTSSKKNNFNGNNNVTMFMEDSEEMSGLESSYQPTATPNYPPPQYQQPPTFSSYQHSAPMNPQPQQTSLYQGVLQTPIMQNQQMTFQEQNNSAVTSVSSENAFQLNPQQSNTSFLTPTNVPDQPSMGVPINSVDDVNSNNLTMIKSFSSESGMNYKWAEK